MNTLKNKDSKIQNVAIECGFLVAQRTIQGKIFENNNFFSLQSISFNGNILWMFMEPSKTITFILKSVICVNINSITKNIVYEKRTLKEHGVVLY